MFEFAVNCYPRHETLIEILPYFRCRNETQKKTPFNPSDLTTPEPWVPNTDRSKRHRCSASKIGEIRDEMMSTELEMLAKKIPTPAAMEPLDAGFVMMPTRLLQEYESDRSGSELGRLFKRANQVHSLVDRVVVLGIGGSYMGARAILESCCQPYWNELSRADRGSKPRMYFEGNNVDNDSSQALLHLLGAHKNKEANDIAERWALVVISKSGGTLETAAAFRQFLSALEVSVGGDRNKLLELLIPVTGDGGKLHKMASELGSYGHVSRSRRSWRPIFNTVRCGIGSHCTAWRQRD